MNIIALFLLFSLLWTGFQIRTRVNLLLTMEWLCLCFHKTELLICFLITSRIGEQMGGKHLTWLVSMYLREEFKKKLIKPSNRAEAASNVGGIVMEVELSALAPVDASAGSGLGFGSCCSAPCVQPCSHWCLCACGSGSLTAHQSQYRQVWGVLHQKEQLYITCTHCWMWN